MFSANEKKKKKKKKKSRSYVITIMVRYLFNIPLITILNKY